MTAVAEERFPPPEFTTSGYKLPATHAPAPLADWRTLLDMSVLFGALSLSAWLVLKRRSRNGVYGLMIFSIAYFGFWREGCVCPIGAIQNVSQGIFDPSFVVPIGVLTFFLLPLIFALIFGRSYCAAVCPHGSLQDAVLVKPVEVPSWLEHALGIVPYLYLGLAVILAAMGSAYVICEYDPFIALFRRNGSAFMLLLGGAFILLGLFVGRPYCRFLCPYGALLRLCGHLSRWRVKIYPDRCIDCHLCETSCPYGAIRPTTPAAPEAARLEGKSRLIGTLVLVPVLMLVCSQLGKQLGGPLSRMHRDVRLADVLVKEDVENTRDTTDDTKAFHQHGQSAEELYAEAGVIYARFRRAGGWFGAWVGLVIGVKLVSLSVRRRRTEHEADRAACVGCARCFEYCPGAEWDGGTGGRGDGGNSAEAGGGRQDAGAATPAAAVQSAIRNPQSAIDEGVPR
jgi:ferredoxin